MTGTLPWGLELDPIPVAGLETDVRYDALTDRIEGTVRNASADVVHVREVAVRASVKAAAASGYTWIQGATNRDEALVHRFGEEPQDNPAVAPEYRIVSGDGVICRSSGMLGLVLPVKPTPALVIGAGDFRVYGCAIDLVLDAGEVEVRELVLRYELGVHLAAGESLDLPPVVVLEGRELPALVDTYAAGVGETMGARIPSATPAGWRGRRSATVGGPAEDAMRNAAALRDSGHIGAYVVIGDGYQARNGDWLEASASLPGGPAATAATIRELGQKPGIWLAPFLLHESSATLRAHPEWALMTTGGERVSEPAAGESHAVLDVMHSGAAAWLRDLIGAIVHDWGFELLQLDHLAFGRGLELGGPRSLPAARVRRGLEIIREAAGEATFLLGGGGPFGPAIGLVDGMRAGPDIEPTWSNGTRNSPARGLRISLSRYWMDGRWWINDLDALLLDGLDDREARFAVTAAALSGGIVLLGDDLSRLPPDRGAMLRALISPSGVAAEPLDPAMAPIAEIWRADLGDGRFLVGALNWTDAPRWVVIGELFRPGEVAFDVWRGAAAGMGDVLVQPHEGVLWQVSAPNLPTPRVVGDSGSVGFAGLFARQVSGRVQVRNDSPAPRIIAIEARGRVFEADLLPGEARWFD